MGGAGRLATRVFYKSTLPTWVPRPTSVCTDCTALRILSGRLSFVVDHSLLHQDHDMAFALTSGMKDCEQGGEQKLQDLGISEARNEVEEQVGLSPIMPDDFVRFPNMAISSW